MAPRVLRGLLGRACSSVKIRRWTASLLVARRPKPWINNLVAISWKYVHFSLRKRRRLNPFEKTSNFPLSEKRFCACRCGRLSGVRGETVNAGDAALVLPGGCLALLRIVFQQSFVTLAEDNCYSWSSETGCGLCVVFSETCLWDTLLCLRG